MAFSVEELCKLWLSAAECTADRWKPLVEEYGSAAGIWEAFPQIKQRLFSPGQRSLLERLYSQSAMEAYAEGLAKNNISVLFQEQEEYPGLLREIEDPPYVLYYAGTLGALSRPAVAMVGTRTPSAYGRSMARSIAQGLAAAGVCVVSGLAYGIDSCAHEGALAGMGTTVAVLGNGISAPYPQEHVPLLRNIVKGGGLAISEYPPDARPMPGHFPHRNRVISGLSRALVFVEGKVKSGGMITVSTALAQGREVFAVPGPVGNSGAEGPHTILREGARLVTSAADILEDLGLGGERACSGMAAQAEEAASPVQRMILTALQRESMTVDQLSIATGIKREAALQELSVMEVLGQIRKEAGNLFSVIR